MHITEGDGAAYWIGAGRAPLEPRPVRIIEAAIYNGWSLILCQVELGLEELGAAQLADLQICAS